ncbi:spheroidene monooxygenase [Sedimentitalea sp. CAU 1593]|uniref:Spheroidene monooxygenase n=1 Tax=Sedimentitalea arenosa TaxID=2798803 RepID=A0A8J7J537_9RHOB|nr:spheroidene monooxygenase [Arenibacterium arenosum]MBJ6370117.1 spheroidene monooxygenase [Arenibacterium arenosum]
MQTVTISFFRFDGVANRVWALAMMGAARLSLARIAGLEFWKLCGSGSDEGFTPKPNTGVYAILCAWTDLDVARSALAQASVFARYRSRSSEHWTLVLSALSSRGQWSGKEPFRASAHDGGAGPIAALTRATIKPAVAMRFWKRVPDISRVIGADPNVLFKIGIGEVPLLHQVTFSIWPDADSMAGFARQDGPHARAIRAVREGKWFSEELYARFRIIDQHGSWSGARPIATKMETT